MLIVESQDAKSLDLVCLEREMDPVRGNTSWIYLRIRKSKAILVRGSCYQRQELRHGYELNVRVKVGLCVQSEVPLACEVKDI